MRTPPSANTRPTVRAAQVAASTPPQALDAIAEDGLPAAVTDRAERIRQAAYALYEQRGCGDGHDFDDWLMAESLVDRERAGSVDEDTPA
ncbi:hypothetical protein Lcho_0904 [Leptothrix cholodnii SP-6]|uniref:DUF2934 domain-containing protein n=1 Tax=Leptothrix cholodnii (strain ATCC 51168 / LMG 8142 / SP-6) TaxID=395495 RepID=B1Y1Z6_LEPCP|nr:DUF2934 domain-containing protein [Leptothrix cholodnii]ACB33176.1 hypothetical protein Lcho_0904 [Leptothrix cholodnii SP-6]